MGSPSEEIGDGLGGGGIAMLCWRGLYTGRCIAGVGLEWVVVVVFLL